MRLAIFSDVHSNSPALKAVLDDIKAQGVDQTYCLGDLVGYAPFPNEVIDLMRREAIPTIAGNYDDGVGSDRDECGCSYRDPEEKRLGEISFQWTKEHVTSENKEFLRNLLKEIRFEAEGKRFLLVHGSPRKINEYLFEDRAISTFERLAKSAEADVVVCGHTHKPYTKATGEVLFINTGSVGKPKDGDVRAAYVLIDVALEVEVRIRRVPYDVKATATAVRESGLPSHFADALETAN